MEARAGKTRACAGRPGSRADHRGSVTKGGEWNRPSAFAPEADTSH